MCYVWARRLCGPGLPLVGLAWVASTKGNGSGIFQAALPPGTPGFTSLFVDGVRRTRARWPNGDVTQDSGLCMRRQSAAAQGWGGFPAWAPTCIEPGANKPNRTGWSGAGGGFGQRAWPTKPKGIPGNRSRTGPTYTSFNSCTGGAAANFDPPFNAWCCGGGSGTETGFAMGGPGSNKVPQQLGTPGQAWTNTDAAVVHMFHPLKWGGCTYAVGHADTRTGNVSFSGGGQQNARGCGASTFYVENVLEELDAEQEWFVSRAGTGEGEGGAATLYYKPASGPVAGAGGGSAGGSAPPTAPRHPSSSRFTASVLETVVRVQGNMSHPVTGLVFDGLTFAHTATTFLAPYEVPSAGDWAVHRGGAVVVEGAEGITVQNCTFDQPGGNGLLLSDYVRNCTIVGNEFRGVGDSGVVSLGRAQRLDDPQDHTDGEFPAGNTVSFNHIHDYGLFGKQTSCYFQSKSCANTIEFNVCYNGR